MSKIKLDHIDTIFVQKSKGWFYGYDFAELFEDATAHPRDAYSDYHIYDMLVKTCEKVLTPQELADIIKNPSSDLLIDRRDMDEKMISHNHIFFKMISALQYVECSRYEIHDLSEVLKTKKKRTQGWDHEKDKGPTEVEPCS